MFIDMLVPVQARAIKHLQIISSGGLFLSPAAIKQLKGLEHLEIQITPWAHIAQCLDRFDLDRGVAAFSGLTLKSYHVNLHFKYAIATEEHVDNATLLAWQMKVQNRILNRVTDDGPPKE